MKNTERTKPKSQFRKPEIFTVFSDEIKNRLDPYFYRPIFKELLAAINSSKYETHPLKEIISVSLAGDWGEEPNDFTPNPDFQLCHVLRNTNFDNKYNLSFDDVAERYIKNGKVEKLALKRDDILIEKSGGSPAQPVGRVAFIEELPFDRPVIFSNFLQKIQIENKNYLPKYVFTYLQAIYHLGYTEFLQNQTTGIKNLRLDDFFELRVPMLPKAQQSKIAKYAFEVRDKAKELEKKARETLASIDGYVLEQLGIAAPRERERERESSSSR